MKEVLYFINPELKDGVNLTVRRGISWANKVRQGDTVYIADTESSEVLASAEITDIRIIPFNTIMNEDLINQHDKSCRNTVGLHNAMKRAYPSFDWREIVTLVYFEVIG